MELAGADSPVIVPPEAADQRVDMFVASQIKKLSRSRAHALLGEGAILVNGRKVRPSHRLSAGDAVSVIIPPPLPLELEPENIPLDIKYEDDHLLVVNKPAGMVVHPAAGNYTGTLVHALLYILPNLSGVGGVARPGIVHRLDKDTSGLIVVAKTDEAHHGLSERIKERSAGRVYLAIVKGRPGPNEGRIEGNIGRSKTNRKKMKVLAQGGKPASTRFAVEAELEAHTLLRLSLDTGRTHQIRAHMMHINCPVLGDTTYGRKGGKELIGRQALHAWKLSFIHPATGQQMEFTAPLPEDMANAIRALGGDPTPYL
ncbi:MAG: RluA family pseudouridine synthase [Nitrospinota bacterium]|nr:RluA family pseudouridine synthase [Nitrospinota bacterium]